MEKTLDSQCELGDDHVETTRGKASYRSSCKFYVVGIVFYNTK